MSADRSSFAPCVHIDNAYLCNGVNMSIDVFELRTRRFQSPLPITLPSENCDNSMSVVLGDELIVITKTHITIINLLYPALKVSQEHSEIVKGQVSNPVKFGNQIYCVNSDGKVLRAGGDKWEIVELVGN